MHLNTVFKRIFTLSFVMVTCFIITWTAFSVDYIDVLFNELHRRRMDCVARETFDREEAAVQSESEKLRIRTNNSEFVVDYNVTTVKDLFHPGFEQSQQHLCPDKGTFLQLLILVSSAPENSYRRSVIRRTWGQFNNGQGVVVAFMVGGRCDPVVSQLLADENSVCGDVIINRNYDTYRYLPLKTLSIFEWVSEFCPKIPFILKVDDDVFINVPKLLEFTNMELFKLFVIYGDLADEWGVVRDRTSKYYVSQKEYSGNKYPKFVTGPAYLMTGDVPAELYKSALNHTFFPLEDVFFTGIVAQRVGVTRVGVPEFSNVERAKMDMCDMQQTISYHSFSYREQLFYLWSMVVNGQTKC